MLTDAQKSLLHLIKQYTPVHDDEARIHHYALTYVEMEPLVFDQRVLPVHVTGSAVVVDASGRRLLMRGLHLPGGHDAGARDVAQIALLHAREDSGVWTLEHARPLRIFDLGLTDIPATDDVKAHRHLDVAFLFRLSGPAMATSGTHWVPVAELVRAPDTRLGRLADKLIAQ